VLDCSDVNYFGCVTYITPQGSMRLIRMLFDRINVSEEMMNRTTQWIRSDPFRTHRAASAKNGNFRVTAQR